MQDPNATENPKLLQPFENHGAIMLLLDPEEGQIVEANQAAVRFYGYPAKTLCSMRMSQISALPESELGEKFQRACTRAQGFFTHPHRLANGDLRTVEVYCSPAEFSGQTYLLSIIHDTTERAQSERALQRQYVFAHALNRIGAAIVTQDSPVPILDEIACTVGEALEMDRSLIYDISFSQHQAIGLCEWLNPKHPDITPTKATYPLDLFIGGATEMRDTQDWIISHADAINPHLLGDGSGPILHEQMNIQSLLWYPFSFRDDGYYLLALNQIYFKREWEQEEFDFLDSVGQLVNVALLKIRLTEANRQAQERLTLLAQAVTQSPHAVVITDLDANVEYVNPAFEAVTGYCTDEVTGKNSRLLHSGKTPRATYDELWARLTRGETWQGEFINRRKDGREFVEFANISPVRQPNGSISHYLAIKEDITDRKRSEERIQYLAHFDVLTGLPNRSRLGEHLDFAINLAKRSSGSLALMFLDLDNFKDINDSLGHSIGDGLLVKLATRLRDMVRAEDTVSRWGGDEFILMLPNIDAQGAAQVARKLLEAISQPIHIERYDLNVSASIGIAMYPDDGSNLETLSRNADTAMYRAKQEGRHSYRFFTQGMQVRTARNLSLSNALCHALERNELQVHYQPQISLSKHRVIGAEALLRWHHPELGEIPPAEFIPVAEDSGLIIPIGEWVLRQAVQQAKAWQNAGMPPLTMAVNLSAVQFHKPDLPDLVTRILNEAGLAPERLELELTERVAMHDPQGAATIMDRLNAHGIGTSIDDFGTGYSSLSYLKKFKVRKLKIDQSFVHDIHRHAEDKAIVSAIIQMARSLGIETLAEGVETAEQLAFLREQGCDDVQGHFYEEAVPADKFAAWIPGFSATGLREAPAP